MKHSKNVLNAFVSSGCLLFGAMFLLTTKSSAQANWSWQHPVTAGRQLNETHFVDSLTGWAVGESGTILKTTDGGTCWQFQNSGVLNSLSGVWFANSQKGWAVGQGDYNTRYKSPILTTTNGGATWLLQMSNDSCVLNTVQFVDEQTGWAAGQRNGKGYLTKTSDGGGSWSAQPTGIASAEFWLNGLHFLNAQLGWVVGSQYVSGVGNQGIILKTTNGGASWAAQQSGATLALNSVFFIDAQTGWTVGDYGKTVKTTDGGTTWELFPATGTIDLHSVHFEDTQVGWAVGAGTWDEYGGILKSTNGGTTWVKQNSGSSSRTSVTLYSAQFMTSLTGFAVGSRGIVLKTNDGGSTWTNSSCATLSDLSAIFFLDANTGWAGGKYGSLLKTTNAGVKWTKISTPNASTINDIYFADSKTGWACQGAGRVLKTNNGGASWSEVTTSTTRAFLAMHFVNAMTGWTVGGGSVYRVIFKTSDGGTTWNQQTAPSGNALTDVFFLDDEVGWAVGMNGAILKSTNGGGDWISQESGTPTNWIEQVYFRDANVGFAVGSDGILKTLNGGDTWTFDDAGSGWIEGISFVDSLHGCAVGGIGGVMSKTIYGDGEISVSGATAKCWNTTDAGATWTQTTWPYRPRLLSSSFADLNSGWAVGNAGAIIKYTDALAIPAPPTELAAAAISETHIRLIWIDNATNEEGFRVFRSDGVSGAFRLVASLGANATSFTDAGLINGTSYWYRICAFNAFGNSAVSRDAFAVAGNVVGVELVGGLPRECELAQNFPNPFNPWTTIRYGLPTRSQVTLTVFNSLGQHVALLLHGEQEAGYHEVRFDGSNLASGMYFYRLQAGDIVQTKKLILLR